MKTIACCLLFAALFVSGLNATVIPVIPHVVVSHPVVVPHTIPHVSIESHPIVEEHPIVVEHSVIPETEEINYTPIHPVVIPVPVHKTDTQSCSSENDVPKRYCCFYLFHAICACESTSLDGCLTDCANWP